jgi:hypothetical protein
MTTGATAALKLSSDARMLFIDANQYLLLYETVTGRKLLAPLWEQKESIFVTAQIVTEVHRRKLELAARFLQGLLQALCLRTIGLPDHLFGIDEKALGALRKRMADLSGDVAEFKEELERLATETLTGRLEIIVSRVLDPLGDQLSWEQFLTRAIGRPKLWIISNDSDYLTTFGQASFLNPFLVNDLRSFCRIVPEVYCFNNLMKGLEHFIRETGAPRGSLPTGAEAAQIEADFLANYYCRNLYLTYSGRGDCGTVPLTYNCGVWTSPKVTLVIQRDRIIVDGQTYPVQPLRPLYVDFVHNGQQFTITE